MNQKGFTNIILVVVIVLLVGAVGYFAFVKKSVPIAQQPTPTPVATQTKTPAPSPTPTPEKKQTANCVNGKFGYELTYPVGWKVWTRGEGEARSATCSENLASYFFAKDLFGTPFKNQINLMVFTRDNQVKEFWQGINALDDYVKRMSAWKVQKETTINGERLVWLGYNQELQLVAYHNSAIYEFTIYLVDSTTLDKFLASFEFTTIALASTKVSNVLPSGSLFTQGEGANIPLSWSVVNPPIGTTIYLDLLSSDGSESLGRITNNPDCSKGGDAIALATSVKSYKWDGLVVCSNWQAHQVSPGSYRLGVSLYSEIGATVIAMGQSKSPFSIQK